MILKRLRVRTGQPNLCTNTYVICDENAKDAMVIDPGGEPEKIIEKYGYETVEKIIKDYNEFAHEKLKKDRRNYDNEKGKITPSQHELFVSTIQLIREYEKEHENISLSYSTDLELKEVIKIFYHATSIYEQLSAAREIKSRLTIILKKEENIGMHI